MLSLFLGLCQASVKGLNTAQQGTSLGKIIPATLSQHLKIISSPEPERINTFGSLCCFPAPRVGNISCCSMLDFVMYIMVRQLPACLFYDDGRRSVGLVAFICFSCCYTHGIIYLFFSALGLLLLILLLSAPLKGRGLGIWLFLASPDGGDSTICFCVQYFTYPPTPGGIKRFVAFGDYPLLLQLEPGGNILQLSISWWPGSSFHPLIDRVLRCWCGAFCGQYSTLSHTKSLLVCGIICSCCDSL